jgi:hypothetical protein
MSGLKRVRTDGTGLGLNFGRLSSGTNVQSFSSGRDPRQANRFCVYRDLSRQGWDV